MSQRVAYTPPEPLEATERRAFTPAQRLAVMERQKGLCAMCGAELQPGYEVDHCVPIWLGGKHEDANWQALCADPCHRAVKTPADAKVIAKVKRLIAKEAGTAPPPTAKLRSRPFRKRWEQHDGNS